MRRTERPGIGQPGMISAQEIARWAYCPEQWRLQYGLGLESENRAAMLSVAVPGNATWPMPHN